LIVVVGRIQKAPEFLSEFRGFAFYRYGSEGGGSSNRQWRGAIQERLPLLVHHQDNDSMLSRETGLESGLRLIPFHNKSHDARGLIPNMMHNHRRPMTGVAPAHGFSKDGNRNHGTSKSCSTFTSVRTAAQALPFGELHWENFEN